MLITAMLIFIAILIGLLPDSVTDVQVCNARPGRSAKYRPLFQLTENDNAKTRKDSMARFVDRPN
jgi:hypothetical protein